MIAPDSIAPNVRVLFCEIGEELHKLKCRSGTAKPKLLFERTIANITVEDAEAIVKVWLAGLSFGWAGATSGCTGIDWTVACTNASEDHTAYTCVQIAIRLKGAG